MTFSFDENFFPSSQVFKFGNRKKSRGQIRRIGWMRNQFIVQFVVLSLQRSTCGTARCLDGRALFCAPISLQMTTKNYASFLTEIWPEGIRRVDFSRCRVIKWIVAPFHENLPNLLNDPRITYMDRMIYNIM